MISIFNIEISVYPCDVLVGKHSHVFNLGIIIFIRKLMPDAITLSGPSVIEVVFFL